MDAAPFRQFLSSKVYASKDDLSEVVGRDKGADEFCTWVFDLRFEWRSRSKKKSLPCLSWRA